VKVCHKGKKTLRVSASAVAAHLGHGDTLGKCSDRKHDDRDDDDDDDRDHKNGNHKGDRDHDDD
jgi:hypothetical protein